MKRASVATSYKFNTRRSVGIGTTFIFSLGVAKKAVTDAFEKAGLDPLTVAQNKITELTKSLIDSEEKRVKADAKNIELQNKINFLLAENKEYKKLNAGDRKKLAKDIIKEWREAVKEEKEKNEAKEKPVVYLSNDGVIYREPKEKYYHRLDINSCRGKLLLALMGNNSYTPTHQIIEITGLSSRKSVENTSYQIRKAIEKKLEIKQFIDGYQDYGYRINPGVIFKKA